MPFRSTVIITGGLIVAAGAASAVFALIFGDIRVFPPTFFIVTVVAVCLGLPVYFAARMARNDTPVVAAVMGFIVGAVIPAIFIFTSTPDQASVGNTATVIDGSYTTAGWLENLAFVGLFGLLGVGGALVFWFLVRRRPSSEVEDAGYSPPPLLQTVVLSVGAAGVIAAAFVIPYATADRSCHNPLRNGGTSIGQTASFDLRVGVDQWRAVEGEMQTFARSGGWSARSDVRPDEGFPWLQISLCKEPGTNIVVQGMADFNEVSFGAYQPQGGSTWRRDFRALYERISARWPTKIAFKNDQGEQTGPPEWATAEKPK